MDDNINQEQRENNSSKTKDRRGCGILIAVLVTIILTVGIIITLTVTGIAYVVSSIGNIDFNENRSQTGMMEKFISGSIGNKNKIAVMTVEGIILSGASESIYTVARTEDICKTLDNAMKDSSIKAIVLKIDSPGGEITATDIIHHKIKEVQSAGIPVIAMLGSMATSGGYYIASPCKKIIANSMTTTGSIGVLISSVNYEGLFKKIGLKSQVFKSGKMKNMLSGAKKTGEKEKEIINKLIRESYNHFLKIVSEGRKQLTLEDIKNSVIADSRVFSGSQAHKLGLVDDLGYFDDAVKAAAEAAKITDYQLIEYEKPFSFSRLLMGQGAMGKNKIKINIPGVSKWTGVLEPGKIYYLPGADY